MSKALKASVGGVALVALVLGAGVTAAQAESWSYPSYNCGSALVESRSESTRYTSHIHTNGAEWRSEDWDNGASYLWRYWTSGLTAVGSIYLNSDGDIRNGGRGCDY